MCFDITRKVCYGPRARAALLRRLPLVLGADSPLLAVVTPTACLDAHSPLWSSCGYPFPQVTYTNLSKWWQELQVGNPRPAPPRPPRSLRREGTRRGRSEGWEGLGARGGRENTETMHGERTEMTQGAPSLTAARRSAGVPQGHPVHCRCQQDRPRHEGARFPSHDDDERRRDFTSILPLPSLPSPLLPGP